MAPSVALADAQWSVVPSPNAGRPASDNSLEGLACVSSDNCVAVGYYATGRNHYDALFERWNGTKWSRVPSADAVSEGDGALLTGVSCSGAESCMAVGGAGATALTEHWNGTKWSISQPPAGDVVLNGVGCPTARYCVAVGYRDNASGNSKTLVEAWNGQRWSTVASPNPGTPAAYTSGPTHSLLNGVSCRSASSCTAVGIYVDASGTEHGLIEHWNGAAWSVQPTPRTPAQVSVDLNAVSCVSDLDCTAVGYSSGTSDGYRTLVVSTDGRAWSIVSSPNPGRAELNDILFSVSCGSPKSCVAVGAADASAVGGGSALAEAWGGTTWSVSPVQAAGSVSGLAAVACSVPARCAAVGTSRTSAGPTRTLAEVGP